MGKMGSRIISLLIMLLLIIGLAPSQIFAADDMNTPTASKNAEIGSGDAEGTEPAEEGFSELRAAPDFNSEILEIADISALQAVISELNTNGGSRTVLLTADFAFSGTANYTLSNGELTILGGGHSLGTTIYVTGSAVLNLGSDGYDETLEIGSSRSDHGVIDVAGTAVLNIYDGVTVKGKYVIGSAGCIAAHDQATVNMYGGVMTGGSSASVSGGIYLDGNSVFNMYGGVITDCTGMQGGAVGLSGGRPLNCIPGNLV